MSPPNIIDSVWNRILQVHTVNTSTNFLIINTCLDNWWNSLMYRFCELVEGLNASELINQYFIKFRMNIFFLSTSIYMHRHRSHYLNWYKFKELQQLQLLHGPSTPTPSPSVKQQLGVKSAMDAPLMGFDLSFENLTNTWTLGDATPDPERI